MYGIFTIHGGSSIGENQVLSGSFGFRDIHGKSIVSCRFSLQSARQTPPEGGATCFADTVSALAALPLEKQEKLKNLEWEDPGLGFIWIFFCSL